MEIDRTVLKQQAREAMKLTSPSFWLVALVCTLLTDGVTLLADLLAAALSVGMANPLGISTPGLFLSILVTLYTTVITFGFQLWSLWTYRRQNPGMGALFQGFSIVGRVIWMQIIILVQTTLFAIPVSLLATMFIIGIPYQAVGALIAVPLVFAAMIAFTFRFSLAPYALADDPDAGASAAIRRSAELMRGWKMELLKLYLSFLGWALLIAVVYALVYLVCSTIELAAGIDLSGGVLAAAASIYSNSGHPVVYGLTALFSLPLTLWLQPYVGVSVAGFYDNRLRLAPQQPEEMPPV